MSKEILQAHFEFRLICLAALESEKKYKYMLFIKRKTNAIIYTDPDANVNVIRFIFA